MEDPRTEALESAQGAIGGLYALLTNEEDLEGWKDVRRMESTPIGQAIEELKAMRGIVEGLPSMSASWTDEDFLGYVEEHCRTEHLHGDHACRLFDLAGVPLDDATRTSAGKRSYVFREDAALTLIARARERMMKAEP